MANFNESAHVGLTTTAGVLGVLALGLQKFSKVSMHYGNDQIKEMNRILKKYDIDGVSATKNLSNEEMGIAEE